MNQIMRNNFKRTAAIWLVLAAAVCTAEAREILLAENGVNRFTVENLDKGDATADLAASQLEYYLNRMTGADFSSPSASGRRIYVGYDRKLSEEEYAIDFRRGNLRLSGGGKRGILYSVYSFLEEAGCMWLAPNYEFYGETGEFVPDRRTLRYCFEKKSIRAPELKYRKLYVEEGHSHTAGNMLQMIDWMAKMQYNVFVFPIDYQGKGRVVWDDVREVLTPELQKRGIIIEVGGHGYQNFINAGMEDGRLFEDHPEYFGMKDGSRSRDMERVFCSSNPEAVEYMVSRLTQYLREHPEIEIFDFWPPDGARWCECGNCALIGGPTDQHSRLVSLTAERMAEEVPGMRIECLGYSLYKNASRRFTLDKNVLVDFCPISQSFEYQIYDPENKTNSGYVNALKEWKELFDGDMSIYSYYRKYAWHSLPILLPHYMQNDVRWYRENGIRGISIYCEPGDWGTYEINLYALGKLAQNPDVDMDALLDRFAECRFGSSCKTAAAAYGTIENIARKVCSIPGTKLKPAADYDRFMSEVSMTIEKVSGAMAQSDAAHKAAWERLSLSLTFLCKDLEIQKERAAGASAEEIRGMADRMIEWAENHFDAGVFLPSKVRKNLFYKQYGVLPK